MRTKDIRPEKIQLIQDIGQLLSASESLFLISYKGLKVEDFSALREALAEQQAECHVVPNRLFLKAAIESGIDNLQAYQLTGDTALVAGGEDAVAVAKVISKFAASHNALSVKIGSLNKQTLSAQEVGQLAQLPGKEILLAQLLGVLQAPARNLAGVLYSRLATIVYVLNAYNESRSQN